MKKPTSHEDIQKVFDCYCKKILRNEAINIQKHYQRMNDLQISLSELTPEQLAHLSVYDEYSTDYNLYTIMGYDVKIKNELLNEALQELSEEERFFLLLYGLGFNDGEIADLLKLVRRTVNYKRQKGFEKIRKKMEEKQHDEE
ncbi:MAG TPA: RNA polymerase subunit sigma-24 [Candidatus Anaerostipes excrementavium]|uniref:RNA polymerase subunit sigma-24 n=1 Tax=Candidatus Anaerostipes excrementavium TaxID=2838463 RepID=A0A9D1WX70_9FIRM|nr:RNA polymerase subunit sigma-24 [uncultured Anaerostipes sp.]HIX68823.1 RNA polymerase subunit sigma-24 [Candidatus Anaerostipes excrementavium]